MKNALLILGLILGNIITTLSGADQIAKAELSNIYDHYRTTESDINQHLSVLRQLARECSSVAEIGTRNMGSTWGIMMGLSESTSPKRSFLEIEYYSPQLKNCILQGA